MLFTLVVRNDGSVKGAREESIACLEKKKSETPCM